MGQFSHAKVQFPQKKKKKKTKYIKCLIFFFLEHLINYINII